MIETLIWNVLITISRFMTLWDGLTSANEAGLPARILILGATNRIQDIDEACATFVSQRLCKHGLSATGRAVEENPRGSSEEGGRVRI